MFTALSIFFAVIFGIVIFSVALGLIGGIVGITFGVFGAAIGLVCEIVFSPVGLVLLIIGIAYLVTRKKTPSN